MNYIPCSGWTMLDGDYPHMCCRKDWGSHPGNVSLWCFASAAHHVRKPNALMPLLEQKDFIATSGWSGFVCEHHTLFLNDGTQLEPASLLPWPYCEPLKQTLFCPPATSSWTKRCTTKHLLSGQRCSPAACIIVIFSDNQFQLIQLLSLPKTIFLSPLELKG